MDKFCCCYGKEPLIKDETKRKSETESQSQTLNYQRILTTDSNRKDSDFASQIPNEENKKKK